MSRNNIAIEPLSIELIERFAKKYLITDSGCWEWKHSTSHGYGLFGINCKIHKAHRVSYAIRHGGLNSELVIDHLCRNKACVNYNHLELVTQAENTRRGNRFNATHCRSGHLLTADNIQQYVKIASNGKPYNERRCRECSLSRHKKYNAKRAIKRMERIL